MTAKNIESLIKNSQFPDPDYKNRLRKQPFESDTRLKNQNRREKTIIENFSNELIAKLKK